MRVLAMVPGFPSLTQPWITRHLVALHREGVDFWVVSNRKESDRRDFGEPEPPDMKVKFVVKRGREMWRRIARGGVRSTARLFPKLMKAWLLSFRLRHSDRPRWKLALEAVYFDHELTPPGKFDVIHVHFHKRARDFLVYSLLTETPLVTTFHGLNPRGSGSNDPRPERDSYRIASKVFTDSEFAKGQVVARGCPAEKVVVAPLGLDIDLFPFRPRPAPAAGETLRLLTVARLAPEKGHAYALLAARRLADAGVRFTWTFAGGGPEEPKLRRMATRLGIAPAIVFGGNIPIGELVPLYHESHLSVLPSVTKSRSGSVETQGVVVQEAQALGCLVIASRVGGIPEYVNDGVDGFLVREGRSRDLSRCILDLLANPGGWLAVQQEGRRNVETNFASDVVVKKVLATLRQVTSA